jgi:hypothetical protein
LEILDVDGSGSTLFFVKKQGWNSTVFLKIFSLTIFFSRSCVFFPSYIFAFLTSQFLKIWLRFVSHQAYICIPNLILHSTIDNGVSNGTLRAKTATLTFKYCAYPFQPPYMVEHVFYLLFPQKLNTNLLALKIASIGPVGQVLAC